MWQRRRYFAGIISSAEDRPVLQEGAVASARAATIEPAGIFDNELWWQHLSSLQQLKLALHLASKALPLWERFAAIQEVSYRVGSAGPLTFIGTNMLQKALKEINHHTQDYFPGSKITKINQYYKLFIGPVSALKDDTTTFYWVQMAILTTSAKRYGQAIKQKRAKKLTGAITAYCR